MPSDNTHTQSDQSLVGRATPDDLTITAAKAPPRGGRTMVTETAIQAVIRVGDGRGFVVQGPRHQKLVITAGHCLPFFPPCHGASYSEERSYQKLLGLLGAYAREAGDRIAEHREAIEAEKKAIREAMAVDDYAEQPTDELTQLRAEVEALKRGHAPDHDHEESERLRYQASMEVEQATQRAPESAAAFG